MDSEDLRSRVSTWLGTPNFLKHKLIMICWVQEEEFVYQLASAQLYILQVDKKTSVFGEAIMVEIVRTYFVVEDSGVVN